MSVQAMEMEDVENEGENERLNNNAPEEEIIDMRAAPDNGPEVAEQQVDVEIDNNPYVVNVAIPCKGDDPDPNENNEPESDTSDNFVGLVNQGGTCYLNSLLQTLYMTPELRDVMWALNADDFAKGSLAYELHKLFIQLKATDTSAIRTTALTKAFGWTASDVFRQNDVQELWRVLFDALEVSFKGTPVIECLKSLYEGEMVNFVKCLNCENTSCRPEAFQDIMLEVKDYQKNQSYGGLEDAIAGFLKPELLDGQNQYRCENCNALCDARKGVAFLTMPYVFTILLKRFGFDPVTSRRTKLNSQLPFPLTLDLTELSSTNLDEIPLVIRKKHCQKTCSKVQDINGNTENGVAGENNIPISSPKDKAKSSLSPMKKNPKRDKSERPSSSSRDLNLDGSPSVKRVVKKEKKNSDNTPATEVKPAEDISDEQPNVTEVVQDSAEIAVDPVKKDEPRKKNIVIKKSVGVKRKVAAESDNVSASLPQKAISTSDSSPKVYELFSILIHKGSPFGGHYYAFIKSLESGKWRSFNDSRVKEVNEEELKEGFGQESYEQSSNTSTSTCAYMLMYRRKDPSNVNTVESAELPPHIKAKLEEYLPSTSRYVETTKVKVWYRSKNGFVPQHLPCVSYVPEDSAACYTRLYLPTDGTLRDIKLKAMERFELLDVPLDRCRLLKYADLVQEVIGEMEGDDNVRISSVIGNANDLIVLIETRKEDEEFENFNPESFDVPVFELNSEPHYIVAKHKISTAKAESVDCFKEKVSNSNNIAATSFHAIIDNCYKVPKLLSDNSAILLSYNANKYSKFYIVRKTEEVVTDENFSTTNVYKLVEKCKGLQFMPAVITIAPQEELIADESNDIPNFDQDIRVDDEDEKFFNFKEILRDDGKIYGEVIMDSKGSVQWLKEKITKLTNVKDIDDMSLYYQNLSKSETEQELVNMSSSIKNHMRLNFPSNFNADIMLNAYNNRDNCKMLGKAYYFDPFDFNNHYKFSVSIVINDKWKISKVKKIVVDKFNSQFDANLSLDRCRLRNKQRNHATLVYSDNETVRNCLSARKTLWEFCVQQVEVGDKLYAPNLEGLFVYIRQFVPQTQVIGPPKELFLPTGTHEDFLSQLLQETHVPAARLAITPSISPYPCLVDWDKMNSSAAWTPVEPQRVPWWETKIYVDGFVIYYKELSEAEPTASTSTAEPYNIGEPALKIRDITTNGLPQTSGYNGATIHECNGDEEIPSTSRQGNGMMPAIEVTINIRNGDEH